MKIKQIYQAIDAFIPFQTQDDFDNSGFMIGSYEADVSGVLFTLDLSEEAIEMAIKNEVQLIITHHPFIFHPLKSICFEEKKGKMIKNLIRHNISVISTHTNLDKSPWGVSFVLSELIGMTESSILIPDLKLPNIGYGRIGDFKIDMRNLIELLKKNTGVSNVILYNGSLDSSVERIAICGGSGSDFIETARKYGANVYITGDIKYHDAELGANIGLPIIDIGHFHSEYLGFKYLIRHLLSQFPFLGIYFYDRPYSSIIFS